MKFTTQVECCNMTIEADSSAECNYEAEKHRKICPTYWYNKGYRDANVHRMRMDALTTQTYSRRYY